MIISIFRLFAVSAAAVVFCVGSAHAVGYERHYVPGIPAPKRIYKVRPPERITKVRPPEHISKVHIPVREIGLPPQESKADRVPAALDHAAGLVRDLMNQFGFNNVKSR